jgi:hypothetical protein
MTGTVSEADDEADADHDAAEEVEAAPGRPDAHLRDLADGSGCTEVWEHLSESREE